MPETFVTEDDLPATITIDGEFMVTGRGLVITGNHEGAVNVGDYFQCERNRVVIECRGVEMFRPIEEFAQRLPIGILVSPGFAKGFFHHGDVFHKVTVTRV